LTQNITKNVSSAPAPNHIQQKHSYSISFSLGTATSISYIG
jgi:hypothetical protein